MAVITAEIVRAHADRLLAIIDNADQAPLEVSALFGSPPGTVEMAGLTAVIFLSDGDAVYALTLQPVIGSADDGVAFVTSESETAEILADPETMAAIVEAEAETGPVSPELRQAADEAWDAGMTGPYL